MNRKYAKKDPIRNEKRRLYGNKSRFVQPGLKPSGMVIPGHGDLQPILGDNLKSDPFRWICYLVSHFNNGFTGYATGSLIGPNTVLTSGHTLLTRYPKNTGDVIYAISTTVYPCKVAYFGYRTCQYSNDQTSQILVFDEW